MVWNLDFFSPGYFHLEILINQPVKWDNRGLMRTITDWWFGRWILFSISYMGCHPSHWRTPSIFKMVKSPPTRYHCLKMIFSAPKKTRISIVLRRSLKKVASGCAIPMILDVQSESFHANRSITIWICCCNKDGGNYVNSPQYIYNLVYYVELCIYTLICFLVHTYTLW